MAENSSGNSRCLRARTARIASAYTYTFDGQTLITRVDATAEPTRMGSDQLRHVSMAGERLVFRPPPRPWKGLMQQRQLVWEKLHAG